MPSLSESPRLARRMNTSRSLLKSCSARSDDMVWKRTVWPSAARIGGPMVPLQSPVPATFGVNSKVFLCSRSRTKRLGRPLALNATRLLAQLKKTTYLPSAVTIDTDEFAVPTSPLLLTLTMFVTPVSKSCQTVWAATVTEASCWYVTQRPSLLTLGKSQA